MASSYNKLKPNNEEEPEGSISFDDHSLLKYTNNHNFLPARSGFNLLLTVITSVWCSILFGYNTGVISPALLKIEKEIPMSNFEKSALVSIILFGAMIGSALTASVIDIIGRRKTILFNNFFFIVGPILAISTTNYFVLITGRFLTGIGVGVSSSVIPAYLSEISPAKRRGALLMTRQLAVSSGIFISYLSGVIFLNHHNGWRIMLGISTIPAVWQLLGFRLLPESPRWLISRGRVEEARLVVIRCDHSLQTEGEVNSIMEEIKTSIAASSGTHWRELLKRKFRFVLTVNVVLNVLQQFTGVNVVIYFSGTVLIRAGFEESTAVLITALLAIPQNFLIFLSLFVIDRAGRRPLLIAGLAGVILALIMVGFSFFDTQSDFILPIVKWVSVGGLLIFKVCFSLSIGPMPLTIAAEISPIAIRGKALSLGSMLNWLANFVVQMTFLELVDVFGDSATWWIYAGCSSVLLLFTIKYVPETKNVSLEELEKRLVKE